MKQRNAIKRKEDEEEASSKLAFGTD